jgi:hypothetical protein
VLAQARQGTTVACQVAPHGESTLSSTPSLSDVGPLRTPAVQVDQHRRALTTSLVPGVMR